MINSSSVNAKTLNNLVRGIYFVGGLFSLILVGLLGSFGLQLMEKRKADDQASAQVNEAKALTVTIEKAKQIKHSAIKKNPSSQVQALMDSSCKKHDVSLIDFLSMSDTVPYLSRFKKNGTSTGWTQTSANAQVRGSLPSIYNMLRSVTTSSIPIEFDSIELQRAPDTDERGQAVVTAKVSFRVLKQEISK